MFLIATLGSGEVAGGSTCAPTERARLAGSGGQQHCGHPDQTGALGAPRLYAEFGSRRAAPPGLPGSRPYAEMATVWPAPAGSPERRSRHTADATTAADPT